MRVRIKRVYEKAARGDGLRVLVDRLWPRGVKKEDAAIDIWAKELAPSNTLRKWFGHDDAKFKEFARRYRAELAKVPESVKNLIQSGRGRTITLVYGAKNTKSNQAVVLQALLQKA